MSETSAADKLAEHKQARSIVGGNPLGFCDVCRKPWPCARSHEPVLTLAGPWCRACDKPGPCDAFALTTRLAEAQENLRAANRRAIVVADESYKAGVASAETRLAEMTPKGPVLCLESHPEWVARNGTCVQCREIGERVKRKSAEQLLSEMAEGVRALDLWAREGSPLTLIQRLDPIILQVRALLAKYDARKAEAR